MNEEELLFEKTWTCPACEKDFKNKTVKAGKVRMVSSDQDLRPVYTPIDSLKYDVVLCPFCGYTALERFFKYLSPHQKSLIKEKITASYAAPKEEKPFYTYEDAIRRYKMALANAMVKGAKASELGYICLKIAWVLRGMKENLPEDTANYESRKAEIEKQETEYMRKAFEKLLAARESEGYPMCGMDETTVDYLLASIGMKFEEYSIASKLLSEIIVSPAASGRVKDKARDMKEVLVKKMQEKNG